MRCVFFNEPIGSSAIGISLKPVVPINQDILFWANDATCCGDPGCAYYDYLREITDIRWRLVNVVSGEYIANSTVHKTNPDSCYAMSPGGGGQGLGWFSNNSDSREYEYSGSLEKGEYFVQCEIWARCNDEDTYNTTLNPTQAPLLPYYDVTSRPFKVVDCDEVVNFSLTVSYGTLEIWGGTVNLDCTIRPAAGLDCTAHQEINIQDGFTAMEGSSFSAKIIPCPDCSDSIGHVPEMFSQVKNEGLVATNPDNLKPQPQVKIYPNPTTGMVNITVSLNFGKPISIKLSHINGNKILDEEKENQDKFILDLSIYPKGIYLLTIKTTDMVFTEKVVLQ